MGRYANRSNERNKNARYNTNTNTNLQSRSSKLKFLFRLICYLTGILLAFLVLIGVIVVLTLMVANKELGIIKEIDF